MLGSISILKSSDFASGGGRICLSRRGDQDVRFRHSIHLLSYGLIIEKAIFRVEITSNVDRSISPTLIQQPLSFLDFWLACPFQSGWILITRLHDEIIKETSRSHRLLDLFKDFSKVACLVTTKRIPISLLN